MESGGGRFPKDPMTLTPKGFEEIDVTVEFEAFEGLDRWLPVGGHRVRREARYRHGPSAGRGQRVHHQGDDTET